MTGIGVAVIFVLLAAVHIYWACGGKKGIEAAIPRENGVPKFEPPPIITFAVALGLFCCAILMLSVSNIIALPFPGWIVRACALVLAVILFARAIGDRNHLGFTKRRREGRFAKADTWFYSPLCIVLGTAIMIQLLAGS